MSLLAVFVPSKILYAYTYEICGAPEEIWKALYAILGSQTIRREDRTKWQIETDWFED